jgi:hypothetical protein
LTLVLNFSNFTSSLPVNISIGGDGVNIDFIVLLGDGEGKIDGLEFTFSEISELVDANLVGVGLVGVVLSNLDEVSQEDGLSVLFLTSSDVGFLVVNLVLLEGVGSRVGVLVVECHCGDGGQEDGHKV